MEEGSLRCDANISLRPYGQEEFGTKTELKNLNSFNFVRKGLEHEEVRQAEVLMSGGVIEQETRRYDEKTGKTILMRVKEGTDDYRYFSEPDAEAACRKNRYSADGNQPSGKRYTKSKHQAASKTG